MFIVRRDTTTIDALPPEFQESLAITFLDPQGRTLADPILDPCERLYFDQVDRLATSLAARLERFNAATELSTPAIATGVSSETQTPAVLLGETSPDLLEARVSLLRYLEQAGIAVLPQKLYSRIPEKHQTALDADLARSAVFVQLLGPYPWTRTDELPDGYEGLQLSRTLSAGMPVLRWRSREVNMAGVSDPLHREQLEAPDVVAMDLEEFKRSVVDEFRKRTVPKPRTSRPTAITSFCSAPTTRIWRWPTQIAALLNDSGIGYDIVDERTPFDQLAQSDDYDGLVVVYGGCQQDWVASQVRLCRRLMLQRKSDKLRCAVYIGPPEPKEPLRCRPAESPGHRMGRPAGLERIPGIGSRRGGHRMSLEPIRARHASPYPGLRPFRQGEAELFFGREAQVDAMLTKLETHRFLAVVGSSGCGKSSLVRAGRSPRWRRGISRRPHPPG